MSIPNLPVDFKDDILNTGVNQKRKYQQTYNSDGSVSFEDVTAYQQKGSNFGAQEVNKTNGAVNNIYAERIVGLDELELVTEPGFFVDALAVKELNDKLTPVVIPSGFVWSTSIILSTKQVNAFKIGRVAHIYICIRNNSSGLVTNGSEIKFLTLPEELAPLYSYIPFSTYASSSVNLRVNAMLFKDDNGIRYLISGTTGVKGYIHMHAAYITKS